MEKYNIEKEKERWNLTHPKVSVWVRMYREKWVLLAPAKCSWFEKGEYIINDKYAELRKFQIDFPDTVFQVMPDSMIGWIDDKNPSWDIHLDYKFNDNNVIDKYQWLFLNNNNTYSITPNFYSIDEAKEDWIIVKESKRKAPIQNISKKEGRRVFHKKYGKGVIIKTDEPLKENEVFVRFNDGLPFLRQSAIAGHEGTHVSEDTMYETSDIVFLEDIDFI